MQVAGRLGDHPVAIALKHSNFDLLCRKSHRIQDFVSVMLGSGSRVDWLYNRNRNFAKQLVKNLVFINKLGRIIDIQPVATTAVFKVCTRGILSRWRGLNNFLYCGKADVIARFSDLRVHNFSGNGLRNKNRDGICKPQPVALVGHFFNFQILDNHMTRYYFRMSSRWRMRRCNA